MKICALTMVYRDYWALEQWYRHHARLLGPEALFVVAHGADVWTIPRDDLSHFDLRRGKMLNAVQAGLLASFDWVIRTDADELICTDPAMGSLREVFAAAGDAPVLTALGLDLVQQPGDGPIADGLFETRKNASFTGHYSKVFAVSKPAQLVLYGTRVPPRRLAGFPFVMPEGLYLVHVKYANLAGLAAANADRMTMATGGQKGLPGTGWREAEADAVQFLDSFATKPVLPWAWARAKTFRALATTPARSERQGIVKAQALRFPFRTVLPDWFGSYD